MRNSKIKDHYSVILYRQDNDLFMEVVNKIEDDSKKVTLFRAVIKAFLIGQGYPVAPSAS
jgi:hypothetical protein